MTDGTKAAIEDLRHDWRTDGDKGTLSLAARYIESARDKDPSAKLTVTENKETLTYTVDEIAGEALFYESQVYSSPTSNRDSLEKARSILRNALTYAPYSIQYREHLADVLLNLHDKTGALKVAQEALEIDPKGLGARKLFDRIESAPVTEAPTYLQSNPDVLMIIGSLMAFGGIVWFVIGLFNGTAAVGVFVAVAGFVVQFVGKVMTNNQTVAQDAARRAREGK